MYVSIFCLSLICWPDCLVHMFVHGPVSCVYPVVLRTYYCCWITRYPFQAREELTTEREKNEQSLADKIQLSEVCPSTTLYYILMYAFTHIIK